MNRGGDSTHHHRSPTPTVDGCDLTPRTQTQTSEQEYSDVTAISNTVLSQHSPKLFTRKPVVCFLEIDKTRVDVFNILPRFLEKLV